MCSYLLFHHSYYEQSDNGRKLVPLLYPFCCMKWKLSGQFINRCTVGVFQYVIIRFSCALISLSTMCMERGELITSYSYNKIDDAILVIINCSQLWALYCLMFFYHEMRVELAPLNPFGKFVTVKAVVFFSFW